MEIVREVVLIVVQAAQIVKVVDIFLIFLEKRQVELLAVM
jgi:hypothetical protein